MGILALSKNDNFTATFNIDSADNLIRIFNVSDETTHQNYFVFFENDNLPIGNHILTVQLTDVVGAAVFEIDYLLYKPTFSFLRDKPVFGRHATKSRVKGVVAGGVIGGTLLFLLLVIGILKWKKKIHVVTPFVTQRSGQLIRNKTHNPNRGEPEAESQVVTETEENPPVRGGLLPVVSATKLWPGWIRIAPTMISKY